MKQALLLGTVMLSACSTHQPVQGNTIDEARAELHQALHTNQRLSPETTHHNAKMMADTLMPSIRVSHDYQSARTRYFDIAVKDMPASLFYVNLVKGMSDSIAVSPEITGNVTLNMKHVTVPQVLQVLEDTHGYIYHGIPGGYEVVPNVLQTKIYSVDYLAVQRLGQSNMHLSSGEVTEVVGGGGSSSGGSSSSSSSGSSGGISSTTVAAGLGNVRTSNEFDFWQQLESTLKVIVGLTRQQVTGAGSNAQGNAGSLGMLSPAPSASGATPSPGSVLVRPRPTIVNEERGVTVNPLAGVVVVRAYPKEQKQVETYLDLVQNNMNRQVILEAKILEVTLHNQYEMGIDWHLLGAKLNAISDFPGTNITLSDFPDIFDIHINWNKSFTTTIRALETQGNIQVLSSPNVSTMNNQKALIKVGDDQFFVTNLTPNTVVAATPTATNNSSNFTPNFSPIFSGVTLDVTPQIDLNNNITLHIHPTISAVKEQTVSFSSGGSVSTFPMAQSTIRETDTVVHAKNGQVVIIGGLMQNDKQEDVGQMPYFGNIPFLGTVFRNTKQQSRKTELVILIKPTVLNKASNNNHVNDAIQRFTEFKQGFHVGGQPDLYGDEGEVPLIKGPKSGAYQSSCVGNACND